MLLIGAGLVLRSFSRLLAVDPGFTTGRVLTLDIALPADRYREVPAREAFYAARSTSCAACPAWRRSAPAS